MSIAAKPSASRRGLAALILAVPVLSGIAYLLVAGAPLSFAFINVGALVAALCLATFAPFPAGIVQSRIAATVLLIGLAWPLIAGPSLDGVSRWISLGGFALHSGMLVILPLAVLAARDRHAAPIIILSVTLLCFAQPDSASCLAISFAALAQGFRQRRSSMLGLGLLAAFASLGASFNGALPPQPFVEGVLPDLWQHTPLAAIALMLVLVGSITALVAVPRDKSGAGLCVAACLIGFVTAALLGAYPTPFIGYGAAPILGLGLALSALRIKAPAPSGIVALEE